MVRHLWVAVTVVTVVIMVLVSTMTVFPVAGL